jgi:hypothetical protein
MIGLPRIPKPGDTLGAPHQSERVVVLPRPFTPAMLERACQSVGFSKPSQSTLFGMLGAQSWKTTTPRALTSHGETIVIEVRSPLEIVLRSESKLPGIPFLDWRRNTQNIDRLALALGAIS